MVGIQGAVTHLVFNLHRPTVARQPASEYHFARLGRFHLCAVPHPDVYAGVELGLALEFSRAVPGGNSGLNIHRPSLGSGSQ